MKAFAPIVLQTKTQTETMMKTAAVLFFLATLVSSCVVHGASDLGGYGNAGPGTSDDELGRVVSHKDEEL